MDDGEDDDVVVRRYLIEDARGLGAGLAIVVVTEFGEIAAGHAFRLC
jgi:hypothetical protein